MKSAIVDQIIKRQGGLTWLERVEPETLFNCLEYEYRKTAKVVKIYPNTHEGWMLFIDESQPERKGVIGYYYRKGVLPVCYLGKLEYRYGRWDFTFITYIDDSPKTIGYFVKQAFDLVG